QGKRCSSVPIGNADIEQVATFASGATSADLPPFRVGSGSVSWRNELGFPLTLTCGGAGACALVVQVEITNGTVFYTAPLCFGSGCLAEPASPAPQQGPGSGGAPATSTAAGTASPVPASAPATVPTANASTTPTVAKASSSSSSAREEQA